MPVLLRSERYRERFFGSNLNHLEEAHEMVVNKMIWVNHAPPTQQGIKQFIERLLIIGSTFSKFVCNKYLLWRLQLINIQN